MLRANTDDAIIIVSDQVRKAQKLTLFKNFKPAASKPHVAKYIAHF